MIMLVLGFLMLAFAIAFGIRLAVFSIKSIYKLAPFVVILASLVFGLWYFNILSPSENTKQYKTERPVDFARTIRQHED